MRAQETGCAALLGGARAQRRGGVPPAHRLGHRGGRRRATSYAGGSPWASPATPTATSPATPAARSARLPSEALELLREAVRQRPGAGAGPARRLRHPARLRPLPYAGAVRGLPRTAAACAARRARRSAPGARTAGAGLALPRVRRPGPARAGARRRAHRRGDRPGAPGRHGAQSSSGDRVLAEVDDTPGDRRRHAGGGAGRRGRLRRRACCSTPGCCWPRRPARDRGGAASLGQRRRPGPPGQPRAAGRWRSASRAIPALQALVRWDPGRPGPARDRRAPVSAHLPPASRVATVTGEPTTWSRRWPPCSCRPGPRCSARSPVEEPRRPRRAAGALRRTGPARLRRRPLVPPCALQAQRSTRKLPHLRVEVDPAELG